MIPVWFNPLAGLLVAVAVLGLVVYIAPVDTARRTHLIRFVCGALAIAGIVLFAIRLIVTT